MHNLTKRTSCGAIALAFAFFLFSYKADAQNVLDACVTTLDAKTISACDEAIKINPNAGKLYYHRAFARIFFDQEDSRIKSDLVSGLKLQPAYIPDAMKILKSYSDWDLKNGKKNSCYIGFSLYFLTAGKPIANSDHATWVKEALNLSHMQGCIITRRASALAHLNGAFGFPRDPKIYIDDLETCYFFNSEGDGRKVCSFILGQIYRDGAPGTIPDSETGYAWLLVSCAEENQAACADASEAKKGLTNSSIQKAQQLAKEFKAN